MRAGPLALGVLVVFATPAVADTPAFHASGHIVGIDPAARNTECALPATDGATGACVRFGNAFERHDWRLAMSAATPPRDLLRISMDLCFLDASGTTILCRLLPGPVYSTRTSDDPTSGIPDGAVAATLTGDGVDVDWSFDID